MNRFLMTACAAMVLASGAVAQQAMTPAQLPAGVGVKRMYINLQTGERRITEVSPRVGDQVWGYDYTLDGSGFYAATWGEGGDNDTEIWDSGALNGDATIDGVQIWYYAAGAQPADSTFTMTFAVSANVGEDVKLAVLDSGVTLQELVTSLNKLGVKPRDIITILQAIKTAGALQAEIEVM